MEDFQVTSSPLKHEMYSFSFFFVSLFCLSVFEISVIRIHIPRLNLDRVTLVQLYRHYLLCCQVSEISPDSTSYLMSSLSPGRAYTLKLAAKNLVGLGNYSEIAPASIRTLHADPEFIPEISIKGITKNAISIGWTDPPEGLAPYIHFYKVRYGHLKKKLH